MVTSGEFSSASLVGDNDDDIVLYHSMVFLTFTKCIINFACILMDSYQFIYQIPCSWFIVSNQVLVSKFGLTWMNYHLYKLCTCVSFRTVFIKRIEVEMRKSEPHSRL